ncbi:MAG TPA: Gfo/Idh/MocA family oxidoreductase [Polyangiaceae bacterium]|nr:Gfo/Idh/MocA family oxidoreductase [Polyangiaceae bacterium]
MAAAQHLQWGVVGTGGIAGDFAQALQHSERCRVVNVVGSSREKGRAFAERWALPRASDTLDDLLADREVDAVYVASPHPLHEAQALAAIAARKAVLCEKPMTIDAAGTERLIAAARAQGVFLMEAFMYRCHPLVREMLARLADGAIGPVRHVRADFSFRVPRNPEGRLFNLGLGGGGILDVGGYPMSFARLIAGHVAGTAFAEPVRLDAIGHIGPTGADEIATALLGFASGLSASVTCGVFHDAGTTAVVFGERGKIVLPNPWIPEGSRQALASRLFIHRDGRETEEVTVQTRLPTYGIEAELVAECLPRLEAPPPAMSWADSLGNMRALDRWREQLQR